MIWVICTIGTSLAAEPVEFGSDESARYLTGLRELYLADNDRDALLAHSNGMLDSYALRAGYQVGEANPQDFFYTLSVAAPGQLRIREHVRGKNGVAVRNRNLSVFGVDPYVQYQCPAQGRSCSIDSPVDGLPLLVIQRDPEGAEALAKALSFLIRNLQKG
ncbi:hypothetical protein GFL09_00225 [Pseudomonas stutzeri]|uniref:Uncharacterized protein n=1 Tax=Stutzerimonas stutzeri KOS6 TaxID=1218352 RepID=A0A061JUZ4_STUST|nr:hypothetical protein [Stutzerimonas stutzeri]EWC42255.1 hypothetical protein B597_006380 [Stutzerimonas stutzeri KOS6]MBK3866138.1 hypothetical protein [Stutzerimonas stutzeri]